jgi:hypothetical protein
MKCIAYKGGYKYQTKQDYSVKTPIKPESDITEPFIMLNRAGKLTIKSGYAWDGPSGPTFDTQNFMRGSLVHDALYQLMRGEFLDDKTYRKKADRLLQKHCKEDGMSRVRAWGVYQGVRFGGGPSADPDNKRPIEHAPNGCPS